MKTVGIIGGVGPETTAKFYLEIIFSTYEKNKVQRPGVLISSVPLPYKIEEDLIIKNIGVERYLPFLLQEASRLEKAGANFLVVPSNSLHIFIDRIRSSVSIPVLSIIEETVKFTKNKNYHNIGIIATSTTISNKLYERAFQKEKITCQIPNELEQTEIGKIILNLVTGQRKAQDRQKLIKIINNFKEKSVDCVTLACTDLQLLLPKHPELIIFDTMKILAEATVNYILN